MNTQTTFGPYRLDELLGRGGMGEVYRAYDTNHRRTVALKRLATHLADDPEFQHRFRREAHSVAQLRNPHVIPVHTYGTIDGQLYIDMRYVDGGDLHDLVQTSGGLHVDRAVFILEQVASALDDAHNNGLVHRDVKPGNVLLDGQIADFCYLADFGITRPATTTRSNTLTRTGAVLGSLAYMAPEQFDGAVTIQSDIYSLTCVFFELLTGVKPYDGEGLPALMHSHMRIPPPRPSNRRPETAIFDEVVARGMAKDAGLRYESAGSLAKAARAALIAQRAEVTEVPTASAAILVDPSIKPGTALPKVHQVAPAPFPSSLSEPMHVHSARHELRPIDASAADTEASDPAASERPRPRGSDGPIRLHSWWAPLAAAVLVLVVLGAGVALLRSSIEVGQLEPAGPAATPAPAIAPASPAAAAAAPIGPVITEAIYTGRTSENDMTIAVGIKDGRAVGYVCDGKTVEAWLEGTVTADGISLQGRTGDTVVTASINQRAVFGTITLGGVARPFSAQIATGKAGLYQSRRTVDGITTRIGWIVLADGTQVGIRTQGGQRTPAPALDPTSLRATDGTEDVHAEPLTGASTVIQR